MAVYTDDSRLHDARRIARISSSRAAVAARGRKRVVIYNTSSLLSMPRVGESAELDGDIGPIAATSSYVYVLSKRALYQLSATDSPALARTIDTDTDNARWLVSIAARNWVLVPYQEHGLALYTNLGVRLAVLPDVAPDLAAVAFDANRYKLFCFSARSSRAAIVSLNSVTGELEKVGEFDGAQDPVGAYAAGAFLVAARSDRVMRWNIGDPLSPVLLTNERSERVLTGVVRYGADHEYVGLHGDTDDELNPSGFPSLPLAGGCENGGNFLALSPALTRLAHSAQFPRGGAIDLDVLEAARDYAYAATQAFMRPFYQTEGVTFRFARRYQPTEVGNPFLIEGIVEGLADPTLYKVEVYGVTDIEYFNAEVALTANGQWSVSCIFNTASVKVARLVRIADDAIMAEDYVDRGLVRSYNVPADDPNWYVLHDRCFIYDQAVAMVAACGMADRAFAERLVDGMLLCQKAGTPAVDSRAGGFSFSYGLNSYEPSTGLTPVVDEYYRTGAEMWCAIALGYFVRVFPGSNRAAAAREALVRSLDHQCLNWLNTTPGDYRCNAFQGGKGKYAVDYSGFDPDFVIEWVSTEHNLDAYFALDLAARLDGVTSGAGFSYREIADNLGAKLVASKDDAELRGFWNPATNRACQGIDTSSSHDTSHALDCGTWYSILCKAIGTPDAVTKGILALDDAIDAYPVAAEDTLATGWTPYLASRGYPGTEEALWVEGTGGMIVAMLAYDRIEVAQAAYNAVLPLARVDGYPYVNVDIIPYELRAWTSMASTGWMVIAFAPELFWEVSQSLRST